MENYLSVDVLVIGAGPTGLTAANLMADYGLDVALIERAPGSGDEPRAISATDETLRVMQQIGIMDRLGPEMLMDTGARYYGLGGRVLADVRPGSPRLGQPGKSQFDQPVMEALLLEAAQARPGLQLYFNTEATAIRDGADAVEVSAVQRGGRSRGASGVQAGDRAEDHAPAPGAAEEQLRFRARWVVACDGGRSFARRELGVAMTGSTQVEKWIVVDLLDVPGTPEPFASFHCNGTRPTVVVPGVRGRRRYEFMLFPGEDEAAMLSRESIARLVAPYQDASAVVVRRAAVYTAHQRVAERYRQGRVLLAGDAAHMMPPFAGQGLNAGIRDAANLAWKVAAEVRGDGTQALVDSYQTERRPHAVEMVKLSKRIGRVVMTTNPAAARLRDAVVLGTRAVPRLNTWLTGMRFLKQPHHTDGVVVAPEADVPAPARALVGRSLPQPMVRTGGERQVPLDELLGIGWSVLVVGAEGALDIYADGGHQRAVDGTAALAAARGTVLLVRPDRYVAGAAPAGQHRRLLEGLSGIVPALADGFAGMART